MLSLVTGQTTRTVRFNIEFGRINKLLTRLNAHAIGKYSHWLGLLYTTESQTISATRMFLFRGKNLSNDINKTRDNYSSSGLSQTRDVGYYASVIR